LINVKDAVQAATDFLNVLLPNARDIMVEEVDKTGTYWNISLSMSLTVGMKTSRCIKVFKVDQEDAEVTSMKIRTS